MPTPNDDVHILVIDYDNCAYFVNSPREDSLTPALIAYIKEHHFDAYYVCTHRSYAGIDWLKYYVENRVAKLDYDKQKFTNNFPTYKITTHLSLATQLPCLGVSTMDDYCYSACGQGFEKVLKPYEAEGKIAEATTPYLSGYKIPLFAYYYGKNPQLLQIAKDCKIKYPNQKVYLTFIDDTRTLCEMALTAEQVLDWPKDVHIAPKHLDASLDQPTIQPVAKPANAPDTQKNNSYFPAFSFFSSPASNTDGQSNNQPLTVNQ